ncbi:MAG: nucleotidyltransferase family protein [Candidatus Micrarchaeota archaeon]
MNAQLRRLSVSRIGLFGSFAHGNASANSDLDFLVSFKQPTFDNYMDLKELLQNRFGRKVDLVTEESLKPSLRHVKEEAAYAEVS